MFQMERFYYNMRCRAKDHLILEDIYNQCDSDYYISYESKLSHVTLGCTISIFDIIITYFTGEGYFRIWRNIHFSINANRRFAYENSYCCKCKLLGCAMRIYVFPCGLGSYRYNKNHTHVKKVGHTSEFLFGIYWWTWKTNNY